MSVMIGGTMPNETAKELIFWLDENVKVQIDQRELGMLCLSGSWLHLCASVGLRIKLTHLP